MMERRKVSGILQEIDKLSRVLNITLQLLVHLKGTPQVKNLDSSYTLFQPNRFQIMTIIFNVLCISFIYSVAT